MKNICMDCGSEYEYDSNNPLGSSSLRCANCRKKNSKLNKFLELLSIAGNGIGQCRKCGYSRNASALVLMDAIDPLVWPKDYEQKRMQARKQFILCLNCEAEIKSGEVSLKVTNANHYPVLVSFFETRVIQEKIPTMYSEEVEEAEVTSDNPDLRQIRTRHEKISGEVVDV